MNDKDVMNNVKKLRIERSITQEQMSKLLCMGRTTYCKLGSGNTSLNYRTLKNIAAALKVPVNRITKDEEKTKNEPLLQAVENMLHMAQHFLVEDLAEMIPYKDLTKEHLAILRTRGLDNKEDYENTPLRGRIYKRGPKGIYNFMLHTLGMSDFFRNNLIEDKYLIAQWEESRKPDTEKFEIDWIDHFDVNIFEMTMPGNEKHYVQIADRDYPKSLPYTEEDQIEYIKLKTGAIDGSYLCSSPDGYSPGTEILN